MFKNIKDSRSGSNGGKQSRQFVSKPSFCIILMLSLFAGGLSEVNVRQNRGIGDSFTDGLKYAGQMFGINTAADVANLVAKAFSNVASSQSNSDWLSSFFQQRQQYSTASQETENLENANSSYENQKQEALETQRHDSVPPAKEHSDLDFSNAKIITGILRLIGFDARKLGALAINALVMIAQAIGTTLMGTFRRKNFGVSTVDGGRLFMQQEQQETSADEDENENEFNSHDQQTDKHPRSLRHGSPIDWFLENPSEDMKSLLAGATDTILADKITNIIEEAEKKSVGGENSAACLKMLVCKSSPLIWGMQKSLKKRLNGKLNSENNNATSQNETKDEEEESTFMNASIFFRHLPSLEEFREYGDVCKQRYGAYCNTSIA